MFVFITNQMYQPVVTFQIRCLTKVSLASQTRLKCTCSLPVQRECRRSGQRTFCFVSTLCISALYVNTVEVEEVMEAWGWGGGYFTAWPLKHVKALSSVLWVCYYLVQGGYDFAGVYLFGCEQKNWKSSQRIVLECAYWYSDWLKGFFL